MCGGMVTLRSESVGDPTLTVGLSPLAIYAKIESGEWCDVVRW